MKELLHPKTNMFARTVRSGLRQSDRFRIAGLRAHQA